MTAQGPQPSDANEVTLNPAAWLIVPTLSLLAGQAMAVLPWQIEVGTAAVLLIPFIFFPSRRWRRWAILVLLAGAMFALGYARHRQLLYPEFSPNHIRALTNADSRLLLEGRLRHE